MNAYFSASSLQLQSPESQQGQYLIHTGQGFPFQLPSADLVQEFSGANFTRESLLYSSSLL